MSYLLHLKMELTNLSPPNLTIGRSFNHFFTQLFVCTLLAPSLTFNRKWHLSYQSTRSYQGSLRHFCWQEKPVPLDRWWWLDQSLPRYHMSFDQSANGNHRPGSWSGSSDRWVLPRNCLGRLLNQRGREKKKKSTLPIIQKMKLGKLENIQTVCWYMDKLEVTVTATLNPSS